MRIAAHPGTGRGSENTQNSRTYAGKPYDQPSRTTQYTRRGEPSGSNMNTQLASEDQNGHISDLIDTAVRTLREIWPAHIIPNVLVSHAPDSTMRPHVAGPLNPSTQDPIHPDLLPTGLPSPPTSPNTEPKENSSPTDGMSGNVTDLRNFVVKVIARSHTTTFVLQTALCYVEATRTKVQQLASLEIAGCGLHEPDPSSRIVLAQDVDYVEQDTDEDNVNLPQTYETSSTSLKRQRPDPPSEKPCVKLPSSPPTPDLPSPLLEPRRTFIAALVLASKFIHDKCYSNRAWAKLVHLPPREISRCERALGDALNWRLWIGKASIQHTIHHDTRTATETAPEPIPGRTLVSNRNNIDQTVIVQPQTLLMAMPVQISITNRWSAPTHISSIDWIPTIAIPSVVFSSGAHSSGVSVNRDPDIDTSIGIARSTPITGIPHNESIMSSARYSMHDRYASQRGYLSL